MIPVLCSRLFNFFGLHTRSTGLRGWVWEMVLAMAVHYYTLIVKLLGKKVSLNYLIKKLNVFWATNGMIQVLDLSNEFFMVRFKNEGDYSHALFEVPGWFLITTFWFNVGDRSLGPLTNMSKKLDWLSGYVFPTFPWSCAMINFSTMLRSSWPSYLHSFQRQICQILCGNWS